MNVIFFSLSVYIFSIYFFFFTPDQFCFLTIILYNEHPHLCRSLPGQLQRKEKIKRTVFCSEDSIAIWHVIRKKKFEMGFRGVTNRFSLHREPAHAFKTKMNAMNWILGAVGQPI